MLTSSILNCTKIITMKKQPADDMLEHFDISDSLRKSEQLESLVSLFIQDTVQKENREAIQI